MLASTAEAVRETCGEAAMYFDPHDYGRLAALMEQAVHDDRQWRERLILAGRERLGCFSWNRSAATLASAVEAMV